MEKVSPKKLSYYQSISSPTPASKQKFEKYLKEANSPIPKEHLDILAKGENMAADLVIPRSEINRLLENGYMEGESGYRLNEDGSSYISIFTN